MGIYPDLMWRKSPDRTPCDGSPYCSESASKPSFSASASSPVTPSLLVRSVTEIERPFAGRTIRLKDV